MFKVNSTIKVNNKDFTITRVDANNIIGTLQGDPSFLKGKRSIYAAELVKTANGFKYDFSAN